MRSGSFHHGWLHTAPGHETQMGDYLSLLAHDGAVLAQVLRLPTKGRNKKRNKPGPQ